LTFDKGNGHRQSQRSSKKKPDITKLVLVKTVLKGELDGIDAYESLKKCGFTRSAWEHFKTGSGTDSEALAA